MWYYFKCSSKSIGDLRKLGVVTIMIRIRVGIGQVSGGAVTGGIAVTAVVNTLTMHLGGTLPIVIVMDGIHKVDVLIPYHGELVKYKYILSR